MAVCWAQEGLALLLSHHNQVEAVAVIDSMVLMLQETGEHSGQVTNGKPPGLRPRRPRGGRDRRPARDKAAEDSTDGTGDGLEGAGGQCCTTDSGGIFVLVGQ